MDDEMKFVFISHSNKGVADGCNDAEITNRLYAYLTSHNIYCWYDKNIKAGAWADQIYEKMIDAAAYILVASRRSLTSDEVKGELSIIKKSGKPLIPYVIDDFFMQQDKQKGSAGYYLGDNMYQAVFADKYATEEEAFERLISLLPPEISKLDCDLSEFEFDATDKILIKYGGERGCVSVPSFVEEIAKEAFLNNATLNKVIIPPSVRKIGKRAFFGCNDLIEVEGMNGVVDIDESAFGRTKLFDDCGDVAVYGGIAFDGDAVNGVIEIPRGVKTVAAGAFRNGDACEIVFPDGLENICARAFADCILIKSVRFPASLKALGSRAFGGCPITDIRFDGVAPIGAAEAFDNYNEITVTEEK